MKNFRKLGQSTFLLLIFGLRHPIVHANFNHNESLLKQAACENLPRRSNEDLWKIAECFQQSGDYAQATASLREIQRKSPQELEASFIAAWLIWNEGQKKGPSASEKAQKEALNELQKLRVSNPTHWRVDVEIGDFYFLHLNAPHLAYPEYLKARERYNGDFSRSVEAASNGRKVAIENRIARTVEILGRPGEAVEASCRALYMDPDDQEALKTIQRLAGSCERKNVKSPLGNS